MEYKMLPTEETQVKNRYFSYNENAQLCVNHGESFDLQTPISTLLDQFSDKKNNEPCLLSFHHILKDKLKNLYQAFVNAIDTFNYQSHYEFTYPIKVNPNIEIIQSLKSYADDNNYKLNFEVGSKSEFLSILSIASIDNKIICNGFKDLNFYQIANFLGKVGYQIIMVIEHIDEVDLLKHFNINEIYFSIGLRLKPLLDDIHSAKFGLNLYEVNLARKEIAKLKLSDKVVLLHGHMGSQLKKIDETKKQINHLVVLYKSLLADFKNLKYIDLGGGLPANYDYGDDLCYSFDYYAKNIINELAYFADFCHIPHPVILTESGRAITADHSILIIHPVYQSLAKQKNDQLFDHSFQNAWLNGEISLNDLKETVDNVHYLPQSQIHRLWYNFSVFQSLPDHWAINQNFPLLPIEDYSESSFICCEIFDISCDADGILKQNNYDHLIQLPTNTIGTLAVMSVGSYQEILGSKHNIIGKTKKIDIDFDLLDNPYFDIKFAENHDNLMAQYGYDVASFHNHIKELMTQYSKESLSDDQYQFIATLTEQSPYLSINFGEKDHENSLAG